MKGQTCPGCKALTYHDEGSHRACSDCGYIGWPWSQPVKGVGQGRGKTCPSCTQLTLHEIVVLEHGETVRRCAVCAYTAIEPASS